jgi:hypothetical protein
MIDRAYGEVIDFLDVYVGVSLAAFNVAGVANLVGVVLCLGPAARRHRNSRPKSRGRARYPPRSLDQIGADLYVVVGANSTCRRRIVDLVVRLNRPRLMTSSVKTSPLSRNSWSSNFKADRASPVEHVLQPSGVSA